MKESVEIFANRVFCMSCFKFFAGKMNTPKLALVYSNVYQDFFLLFFTQLGSEKFSPPGCIILLIIWLVSIAIEKEEDAAARFAFFSALNFTLPTVLRNNVPFKRYSPTT